MSKRKNKITLEKKLLQLKQILTHLVDIPENEINVALNLFKPVSFPKGENLLSEGKVCKNLYFINSGLTKSYLLNEGKVYIRQFAGNDFVVDLGSFLSKKFLLPLITLLFCFSCENDKGSNEKQKSTKQKISKEIPPPSCSETEKINSETSDPIITQTCIWGKYKFATIGSPDFQGRYSYEYEVYKITDKDEIKINNQDIFNSRINELEKLINTEIAKEIKKYREDPDDSVCLSQLGNPYFSINEMGITIIPSDKMEFRVTFGLGGACMNVDGANASFSLNHIKNYIR